MKPDVAQRPENDSEISATVGSEQAGDVLKEEPSAWANKLICDSGELEEESGPGAGQSGSSSGDGEVLAGASATEKVKAGVGAPTPVPILIVPISFSRGSSIISSDQPYVVTAGDSGPVLGEDSPAPGVGFALEDDSHSCALESKVHAADA